MSDAPDFACARCGRSDRVPLGTPPFPDDLGKRIATSVCGDCWEDWKRHQMAIINHYALNVRDPKARAFLIASLRSYLFGEAAPEGPGPAV
ncbi:MAG: Fe(2+)-trafficking protein [Gemmatimonadota bacterium]|nr:Fe(2+)-trafficking protein [Gemmatimonadota bacterium]